MKKSDTVDKLYKQKLADFKKEKSEKERDDEFEALNWKFEAEIADYIYGSLKQDISLDAIMDNIDASVSNSIRYFLTRNEYPVLRKIMDVIFVENDVHPVKTKKKIMAAVESYIAENVRERRKSKKN